LQASWSPLSSITVNAIRRPAETGRQARKTPILRAFLA
jgi:hypothetical protein